MTADALSISQAIALFPPEFSPNSIVRKSPQLIATPMGIVEYHATKEYKVSNCPVWWTATNSIDKYNVKWIAIGIGHDGIVLTPSSVILDYAKYNSISTLKFGRQNIRIKKECGKLLMYESGAKSIDLTPYFIHV